MNMHAAAAPSPRLLQALFEPFAVLASLTKFSAGFAPTGAFRNAGEWSAAITENAGI